MKYNFCTHFDINYIAHARSLHDSLVANCESFTLYMFCMCDESFHSLKKNNYPNVVLIHFSELESFVPELLIAKANRSMVEYFYTCSPATCYFVLNSFEDVDLITYLDADLYFFSAPDAVFSELGDKSVGMIEHRFSRFAKRNIVYGKFNVGWLNFRKDSDGMRCLKDWMDDCINWCYQRLEGDKYADQKYLDTWPVKYNNVKIIENKGANLAFWNISNYKLKKNEDVIYVDEDRLIFYHFANLKQIDSLLFKTDLSRVFARTAGIVKNDIYLPYVKKLILYKNNKPKIFAKKDAHISGIYSFIVNMTRMLRDRFFPDLIEVK